MGIRRMIPCLLLAMACLAPIARSQDESPFEGETTVPDAPAGPAGWKGLPGAKDPGEPGKAPGWVEIDLKIVRVEKEWPFRTLKESVKVGKTNQGSWIDVTGGTLPLTGLKGGRLKFVALPNKITLDADGDGQVETPVQTEILTVKARRADGTEGTHHFRLRRDGDAYLYDRACMATGKLPDGTPVAFMDEDNSGDYGEVGDAVRIGSSPTAQPTSAVIHAKGALWCIRVNGAGTKAWAKPYEGPKGRIDLASGYKGKSRPLYLMLRQGDVVIDAAAKETPLPAGTWALEEGVVGPSMFQSARIGPGGMKPLVVEDGGSTTLAWGAPYRIDFTAAKSGNLLEISNLRVLGQGGEEYTDFKPRKFTPNVQVAEDDPKRRIIVEKNMAAGVSGGEAPAFLSMRLPTDRPYVVRLLNDVTYMGRFESEWK